MGCPNFFKFHPEASFGQYCERFDYEEDKLKNAVKASEIYAGIEMVGTSPGTDTVMLALKRMDIQGVTDSLYKNQKDTEVHEKAIEEHIISDQEIQVDSEADKEDKHDYKSQDDVHYKKSDENSRIYHDSIREDVMEYSGSSMEDHDLELVTEQETIRKEKEKIKANTPIVNEVTPINTPTTIKSMLTRRTIRMFEQRKINFQYLEEMINAARLAPSARNLQPLEYIIVDSPFLVKNIFSCMGFGGEMKIPDKKTATAYIIILANKEIDSPWLQYDSGMAAENIMLKAWENGIGSCIIAKIDRKNIVSMLSIPENYRVDLAIALGYPAENPSVDEIEAEEKTDYYRDASGVLHIPKKKIESIMHRNGF